MKSLGILLCTLFLGLTVYGQVSNPGMTDQYDSVALGKVSVEGYVDVYFLNDFSTPPNQERPYAVSSNRDHEFNINLAFIDIKYRSERIRARLTPGFGNYINANYATESGTLKNLIEANAGVLLFPKKNIWLDAGVLGSPFTNESAISKDHLMYSRSLAPEYVPYFITGIKASIPINKQFTFYGYLLNGWQNIQDQNRSLALATQLEYRPNNQWLFNLNLFGGDESSIQRPSFRNRWFVDLYAVWKSGSSWSATACAYWGIQQMQISPNQQVGKGWGQLNGILQYAWNKKSALAVRAEYFHDPDGIQINSVNPTLTGFSTSGFGICYNYQLSKQALFRAEYRNFTSSNQHFYSDKSVFSNTNHLLITNFTVWF